MAVNQVRWVRNIDGGPAWKFKLKDPAGASTPIKAGEICKVTSLILAPLAADESMSANIVVSDHETRSGDLAGYRTCIVPRPGDIFEIPLATAANPDPAAALYYSSSQALTTSGSNQIGQVVDDSMLPSQGFQSVSPSYDAGTTVMTRGSVRFMFKASTSFYAALQA